jgi:hypothetical protein
MSVVLNRAVELSGFNMAMDFSAPFKCQPFYAYKSWEKAVNALSATHPTDVSIVEASDDTLSAWDEHETLLGQFVPSGIGWLHVLH